MLGISIFLISLAYTIGYTPDCAEDGYLADPHNCSVFYACAGGVAHPIACADGLHFNPVTLVCDWPESAGCNDPRSICQGINDTLLPDPNDCGRFYSCDNGVAVSFKCPDGLHFNQTHQICDWPSQAGCKDRTTNPTVCDGVIPGQHELVPDPEDCERFYSCSNGVPVAMACPDSLHFNYYNQTCDWPENVQCDQDLTTTELYA